MFTCNVVIRLYMQISPLPNHMTQEGAICFSFFSAIPDISIGDPASCFYRVSHADKLSNCYFSLVSADACCDLELLQQ